MAQFPIPDTTYGIKFNKDKMYWRYWKWKAFHSSHMLHTFHLWVSYHRFLWCEIKPISYLFCVARMWPFLSFEDFWDFLTLKIIALTESFYCINIAPFVERLFNLVSMPLLELRTGNSEAVPCSLEKSLEGTFIYTLKDSLITYIQHQVSWPYLTGIRILLCSYTELWRQEERIAEPTGEWLILRIPCSDLFYVVWFKIKMGENFTDSCSFMYLYLIPLQKTLSYCQEYKGRETIRRQNWLAFHHFFSFGKARL